MNNSLCDWENESACVNDVEGVKETELLPVGDSEKVFVMDRDGEALSEISEDTEGVNETCCENVSDSDSDEDCESVRL